MTDTTHATEAEGKEAMKELTAAEALDAVEERIRHQAGPSDPMSMVWRAHMADLMHVEAVRLLLSTPEGAGDDLPGPPS